MKVFPLNIPGYDCEYNTPPSHLDTQGGLSESKFHFYMRRYKRPDDYLMLGDHVTFKDEETGRVHKGEVTGLYPYTFTVSFRVGPNHVLMRRGFQVFDYLKGDVYRTKLKYT